MWKLYPLKGHACFFCQAPLWKRQMAVPVANLTLEQRQTHRFLDDMRIIPQFFQFDIVNHPKHGKRCCILPAQVDVEGNTPLHVAVEAHPRMKGRLKLAKHNSL